MAAVGVDEQHALDMAIGNLVLREMYEEDTWAELTIKIDRVRHYFMLRADTQPGIDPAGELHHAIAQLVNVHVHAGSDLTTAIYRYDKDPNGRWDMVARFSYAPDLSPNE
ncbi:hypothetical protein [Actinoallomurus sp. CA-150999]|uniref:hypothetical protein n=1 Tax=Actinoallomurus sp. CA-150999 TaxID=3239887 RepID=UPI003D91F557